MNHTAPIHDLLQRLDAAASADKRAWWERYMRGAIRFRGVGIPTIRTIVRDWRRDSALDTRSPQAQLPVALALFEGDYCEDKLAGTLYLELFLRDALPWPMLFEAYANLFDRELIFDWNTCDWFCVRVLGPTLAVHGAPVADVLAAWSAEPYLWRARAGVVPFIQVAERAALYPTIETVCARLIQREERFAKTAVGWLLREVWAHDAPFVEQFIDLHTRNFTLETVRNALKHAPAAVRDPFVARIKATGGRAQ